MSHDLAQINEIIQSLAEKVVYYAERAFIKPDNFLEIGGKSIFRNNVWGRIRGIWQADHRYNKKQGLYDFPQKKNRHEDHEYFPIVGM